MVVLWDSRHLLCAVAKKALKAVQVFLLNGQTFPGFAVVYKKAGLVYKLEGDAEDLF